MNNKYTIPTIVAILAISHYIAYWQGSKKPAEIQVKEVVKDVIKRDVVTQIKEVTRPDGTKEVVTVINDKTQESHAKIAETVVKESLKNWMIGASYNVLKPAYSAEVSRRVLGPLFISVQGSTNGDLFLGVKAEF